MLLYELSFELLMMYDTSLNETTKSLMREIYITGSFLKYTARLLISTVQPQLVISTVPPEFNSAVAVELPPFMELLQSNSNKSYFAVATKMAITPQLLQSCFSSNITV